MLSSLVEPVSFLSSARPASCQWGHKGPDAPSAFHTHYVYYLSNCIFVELLFYTLRFPWRGQESCGTSRPVTSTGSGHCGARLAPYKNILTSYIRQKQGWKEAEINLEILRHGFPPADIRSPHNFNLRDFYLRLQYCIYSYLLIYSTKLFYFSL